MRNRHAKGWTQDEGGNRRRQPRSLVRDNAEVGTARSAAAAGTPAAAVGAGPADPSAARNQSARAGRGRARAAGDSGSLVELFRDQRLEVGLGTRAIMGNHFRGRDGAHAQALLERAALRLAGEEAGGEQITRPGRSEEHTSELQSLMSISYA